MPQHNNGHAVQAAPEALEVIDEVGGWAARLDLIFVLVMVACVVRARLKWVSDYMFFTTKYIRSKAGLKGLLASLGAPVVLDILLFIPSAIFGFRWSKKKKKTAEEQRLDEIQAAVIGINTRLDRMEADASYNGSEDPYGRRSRLGSDRMGLVRIERKPVREQHSDTAGERRRSLS